MKISTPTSINCIQTPSTLAQAFKSQFGFGEERWIYNLVKMFPHSSAYKGRDHKGLLIYRLSPVGFMPRVGLEVKLGHIIFNTIFEE